MSAAEALASLHSNSNGLTSGEADTRRREFGPNRLVGLKERSEIFQFAAQLTHFFALTLWAAAALALVADYRSPGSGMRTLAAAIVVIILVNGVFSFWQERRAHRAIAALQRLLPQSVRVRRDGRLIDLPSPQLVPGDVIELAEGDHVPADCRLVEAFDLTVNNAALTGESVPQPRTAAADAGAPNDAPASWRTMLLAGTSIAAGQALAVVASTGMRTEVGRIAHLTQAAPEAIAPIQREVARLSRLIAVLSVLLGLALFMVGQLIGLPFWDNFVFGIGVIVANVPEGLLPTLTLSMALAAQRMAARHALTRHLPAIQTLGSATVICTDKTGTLTENRIAARRVFVPGELVAVSDLVSRPELTATHRSLFDASALCHTLSSIDDGAGPAWRGDPIEIALVDMARTVRPDIRPQRRLDLVPFSPERRRMTTLHANGDAVVLFTKGALEAVLPECTSYDAGGGLTAPIASIQQSILDAEAAMASDGLRVLAFAYRCLSAIPERNHLEEALTFAGLVGLQDPPRPEVPSAIARCREAGIKVVMVTGDHPQTGLAVARAIGLAKGERPTVLTGHDLDRLTDAQLRFVLDDAELVFARVSAEQKLRIVRAFQQAGAIVAVTGDGVNDAPALKAADIGVAMGITGTDVAREAADVVLLDDNFASIVAAVEEGRGVFDNIRKFTSYVLTSNVPELVPYLAFVLLRIPLPLTIIQILAVDLGTDMVPALGLGAEPPERDVMSRSPFTSRRIIDARLLARAYLLLGGIEAAAAMTAYAFVLARGGWHWGMPLGATSMLYRQATTACLTAIVVTQVANVFACRSDARPSSLAGVRANKVIVLGVALELGLIAIIDYTPLGHALFGTAPIPVAAWLVALPFAVMLIIADRIQKRAACRRAARNHDGRSWHLADSSPRPTPP